MRRLKTPGLLLLLALAFAWPGQAATTNSLAWDSAADRVSADLRGEPLWPLLEDIAHQTGWHIFVEPKAARDVDVKFSGLPSGEALEKLLGDLNFAFVPKTNEASQLYVFVTRRENATRPVTVDASRTTLAKQKHIANELLVKVKPGTDIDALAKALGAKVIGHDDQHGLYRLQFADAAATDAALAQLKNNSAVQAVDYNYIYDQPPAPQPLDNPPVGPLKLTLNPTSKSNDPCNPIIGLIDTQVQSLGSQLDAFIMKPISVVGDAAAAAGPAQAQSLGNPTALLAPQQVSGAAGAAPTHGTAMAETILRAVSQAGNGSSSVKILPVQVFDATEQASTWSVALGVQAAVNGGATVLNMSLGGTADSSILDGVIQQALAQGVVIFAAAGNQPVNTPTYPAAIPGVNAVTALGAPGQLAAYANYGSFVGMALPGASVVYMGGQSYMVQGTSPATAYATGVAVGTKGVDCLTWAQIQSAMQQKFPVPAK